MLATVDPGLSRPEAQLTHAERRRLRRCERTPDGRLLKPGQRLPTPDEQEEAIKAGCRYRGAGFPDGPQWRLTSRNVYSWLRHNFEARRGDTNHFRAQGDLSEHPFSQLLWDLDCYHDLSRRGLLRPDLSLTEYLCAGREEWGWIGWLVEQWRAVERGEASALDTDDSEEDDG